MLELCNITIEHLDSHCVTDRKQPELSFMLKSDKNNVSLKKAVVTIGGWTKEVTSQHGISYNGQPLQPFTNYEAVITAWDQDDEMATGSMQFETGRLDEPWQAQWITDGSYQFTEKKVSPVPMSFLREFSIRGPVKKARIYATAMGIYELCFNGEKAGQEYFAPGYTTYKSNLQYQTYDITETIKSQNELSAVVAGGWAVGAFNYKRVNRASARRQAFLCEIRIEYEDGTLEVIGTDEKYLVSRESNYVAADFYDGECYDATFQKETAEYHNASIEHLRIHPQITAQYGAPVRACQELVAVRISEDGVVPAIYDFGQNFAGVIEARLHATHGQKIVIRHGEILKDGKLFTEPLRTAKQEVIYIAKEGFQTYSPKLTYMGFRYVTVEGIDPSDLNLIGIVLSSAYEESGSFRCSSDALNRLQQNILWSAKSNFVDIPTDCPQRDERMGWTGDIAVFAPTALYNYSLSRFLEKWLKDVKAEQKKGGGIPMVIPWTIVPMQWEIMIPMAVDHWGDACIWVPWAEYMATGNTRLLKDLYPVMKKYMKACRFWSGLFSLGKHRYIWKLLHHYGDWCAPGIGLMKWMGRGKWTATSAMARSAYTMEQIAEVLGEKEDQHYYRTLGDHASDAYRSILMEPDCRVKHEFQTAYVLPLHYNMVHGEDRTQTASHLVRLVREEGHHIGTGFPGTPYILFALADNGYLKDAYQMLMKDTCPSWLYEVKAGGTTIWERWDALREDGTCNTGADDGTNGMVSFNHYASGAVGAFFYNRIAGIEALEPGYQKFQIKPLPGGGLTWADATVATPYGAIASSWNISEGMFTLRVEIPAGTECQIIMPGGDCHSTGSGIYQYQETITDFL